MSRHWKQIPAKELQRIVTLHDEAEVETTAYCIVERLRMRRPFLAHDVFADLLAIIKEEL